LEILTSTILANQSGSYEIYATGQCPALFISTIHRVFDVSESKVFTDSLKSDEFIAEGHLPINEGSFLRRYYKHKINKWKRPGAISPFASHQHTSFTMSSTDYFLEHLIFIIKSLSTNKRDYSRRIGKSCGVGDLPIPNERFCL